MKNLATVLIAVGVSVIALSLVIFILIFYPVIKAELNYQIHQNSKAVQTKKIEPIDIQFGIVIPKIGANAKVIANIDPFNEREYQVALTGGVAHARGTVYPGEVGNIFIFSHSSVNFYQAQRYNSIFYLLDKMNKDDEILLYYKGKTFKYKVTDKKIVDASAIQYLKSLGFDKTVTLMTCWPPGTTFKRLLIIAKSA